MFCANCDPCNFLQYWHFIQTSPSEIHSCIYRIAVFSVRGTHLRSRAMFFCFMPKKTSKKFRLFFYQILHIFVRFHPPKKLFKVYPSARKSSSTFPPCPFLLSLLVYAQMLSCSAAAAVGTKRRRKQLFLSFRARTHSLQNVVFVLLLSTPLGRQRPPPLAKDRLHQRQYDSTHPQENIPSCFFPKFKVSYVSEGLRWTKKIEVRKRKLFMRDGKNNFRN